MPLFAELWRRMNGFQTGFRLKPVLQYGAGWLDILCK